jgi:hypothetical protein
MWQKMIVGLALELVLSSTGIVTAKNAKEQSTPQHDVTWHFFHYAIVRNYVSHGTGVIPPVRDVIVLMEERAFTEENLKSLYDRLTTRFPDPYEMDVWVYTNLLDVPTPEQMDAGGTSETKDALPESGSPTAVFVRNDYNEYINYFYSTPKAREHGHVVIRAPKNQK